MAWQDASEIAVGSNGEVSFAPVGTTLPAKSSDPTAKLNNAFVGAGYLTEDGFTPSVGSEITDINAWQSIDPVRREKTAAPKSIAFTMQQLNEANLVLAFGGGEVEDHGSTYSYTFPEGDDAVDERSLVIDAADGDKHYRFVFPRGTVTDTVESQWQRGAPALLPVTFGVMRPEDNSPSAYLITDDPAFAAGS